MRSITGEWRPTVVAVSIGLLAVAGMAISVYLLNIHLYQVSCNFGGCDIVNTSPYSEMFGIPVALLGLGYYAVVLVLAILRWQGALGSRMPLILTGVAGWGIIYSAYLTYLELYVIHAVCPWCVISALIVTAIFVISLVDWRRWQGA